MKFRNILTGALAIAMAAGSSHAATLAAWTFENATTGSGGPFTPESGEVTTSTASAVTGATFSTPAGNGSLKSLSSNGWDVNDYFEFSTSTTGYVGITIAFDQMGSNTGPANFKLQYSTGAGFTDFGTYAVINNSWSNSTPKTGSSYFFDLSSVTALDNAASVTFRLVDTSTTAIAGANPVASTGTGRIDNVVIATIPEPASALLGAVGLLGLLRRRR